MQWREQWHVIWTHPRIAEVTYRRLWHFHSISSQNENAIGPPRLRSKVLSLVSRESLHGPPLGPLPNLPWIRLNLAEIVPGRKLKFPSPFGMTAPAALCIIPNTSSRHFCTPIAVAVLINWSLIWFRELYAMKSSNERRNGLHHY